MKVHTHSSNQFWPFFSQFLNEVSSADCPAVNALNEQCPENSTAHFTIQTASLYCVLIQISLQSEAAPRTNDVIMFKQKIASEYTIHKVHLCEIGWLFQTDHKIKLINVPKLSAAFVAFHPF